MRKKVNKNSNNPEKLKKHNDIKKFIENKRPTKSH